MVAISTRVFVNQIANARPAKASIAKSCNNQTSRRQRQCNNCISGAGPRMRGMAVTIDTKKHAQRYIAVRKTAYLWASTVRQLRRRVGGTYEQFGSNGWRAAPPSSERDSPSLPGDELDCFCRRPACGHAGSRVTISTKSTPKQTACPRVCSRHALPAE
jgi:hypothetical protein